MKQSESHKPGDAIEALLEKAAPRPVPPPDDEQAIREAVRAEWQTVVGGRRSRSRSLRYAIAAGIVLAVTAGLSVLMPTDIEPIEVASIDRSMGTIYLLGDRAELIDLGQAGTVRAGQLIETSDDAGLLLTWRNGGSLRVDALTRIEFIDAESVFLHRGRIYFDSGINGDARLVVSSALGDVTHIGTQYMAAASHDQLVVSVREGQVRVSGRYYDQMADAGRQIRYVGTARPIVAEFSGHDAEWAWAETLSPRIDLHNQTAFDFLAWVGRETGHKVEYQDPAAKSLAMSTTLVGQVEADPRTELRLRMMTTDLDYSFDAVLGTIAVRVTEPGSR